MIFPPLFAFFGKTRSADSGHGSLSRGWFGGAAVRVFGVDEVEGCGREPRVEAEGAAATHNASLRWGRIGHLRPFAKAAGRSRYRRRIYRMVDIFIIYWLD